MKRVKKRRGEERGGEKCRGNAESKPEQAPAFVFFHSCPLRKRFRDPTDPVWPGKRGREGGVRERMRAERETGRDRETQRERKKEEQFPCGCCLQV